MKRITITLFLFITAAAFASDSAKYRPLPGDEPALGRYLVTLSDSTAAEDSSSLAASLAKMYGARIEPFARDGFRGFLIVAAPSRARMISADPRVALVEQQAGAAPVAAIVRSTPAPIAAVAASTPRPASAPVFTPVSLSGTPSWDSGLYQYDGAGNVIAIGNDDYSYDGASRLTAATAKTPGHDDNEQGFQYDDYGNLTAVTQVTAFGPTSWTNNIDAATNRHKASCNAVTPCVIAEYDKSGNMQKLNGQDAFSWDAAGAVKEVTLPQRRQRFVYDANDERVTVYNVKVNLDQTISIAGERYTIRGSDQRVSRELVVDPASGWHWSKDYVNVGGKVFAAFVAGEPAAGPHRHYHPDHLGTPRMITDAQGYVVARHTYWPFGAEAAGSDITADKERLKFTGHERDSADFETSAATSSPGWDMDYMHARYYRPQEGRFVSVDPVIEAEKSILEPQRWNRYAYVRSNPINKVDPTGRYEVDVHRNLTFVLARAAGFSGAQAAQIANANQGVDDDPSTNPFLSYDARDQYHFASFQRREAMWNDFQSSGSLSKLGQYLHAQQDSFSHDGFGPVQGHLVAGHGPDKTNQDAAKAMTMAANTFNKLNAAADKLGIPRNDRVAWKEIRTAVLVFSIARTQAQKDAAIKDLRDTIDQARKRNNLGTP